MVKIIENHYDNRLEMIISDEYQSIYHDMPMYGPICIIPALNKIMIEAINEEANPRGSINPYTGKVTQ